MDNKRFISKLNDITREHRLILPTLRKDETPSSEFLADWAKFLEMCVRKGVSLSDDRWQRVTVEPKTRHTYFILEEGDETSSDEDFRVGLQLLMGMLEEKDEEED